MTEAPCIVAFANGEKITAQMRSEDLQRWLAEAQNRGEYYDLSNAVGAEPGSVWVNSLNVVSVMAARSCERVVEMRGAEE